ncbi:hypothetical protein STFE110948_01845 [Streptobacillus felis]
MAPFFEGRKVNKKFRRLILLIILIMSIFVYFEAKKEENFKEVIYSKPKKFSIDKIDVDLSLEVPKNEICENVEKCALLGDLYLDEYYFDFGEEEFEEFETESDKIGDMDARKVLGLVEVKDDKLDKIDFKMKANQEKNFREIFNIFVKMTPKKWREDITLVEAYSNSFSAAYVSTTEDSLEEQMLGINVDDVNDSKDGIISVLIHELGHVFSLNKSQYKILDCEEVEFGNELECFLDDSYLNKFYKTFYLNVSRDWRENSNKSEIDFQKFYEINKDNFVSSYAVNNIYEDFSDSFMFFVLNQFPEEGKAYEEKIKFFYNYPELVLLRAQLLKNIVDNDLHK